MSESGVKVVALTNIPRGARSKSFLLDTVTAGSDSVPKHPLKVGIGSNGEIQPTGRSTSLSTFWPKLIKLASDCHVQNVRLSRFSSTEVILQATKDVLAGQELLVWFGDDILADDTGIPPYLSPFNIRGGNCYVCQECRREYEAPNLLKIHIALRCNSLSIEALWTRLSKCVPQASPTFTHLLRTSPLPSSKPATPTLPVIPMIMPAPGLLHLQPYVPVSSFQPGSLLTSAHHIKPDHTSPQEQHLNNNNGNGGVQRINGDKVMTPADPQAQLESIVSNMGKARNGHMCLYCGKLYSRKYGLKIHIRTHTGYKPLRCRICHRPFGDPSNLNKHIRLHSDGNTPYRCEICSKVLVRKRDLDRHIRSRHTNTLQEAVVVDYTVNGRTAGTPTSEVSHHHNGSSSSCA